MRSYISIVVNILVVFVSLLLYTHFFQYILWSNTIGPKLIWFYLFGCFSVIFFSCIFLRRKFGYDTNNKLVLFLLLIPLIASIIKLVTTDQSIETERISILVFFSVSQYYILKILNVREKEIVIAFSVFGLITLGIQIFQQFSNIPLFGIINNDELFAYQVRNGILRYYVGCMLISIWGICFWWSFFLKKKSLVNLLFVILFLVSIYIYMVKQNILATLIGLFLSVFFISDKKLKRWTIFFLLVLSFLLFFYYDILFSELVTQYTSDTYTTDIRFQCIEFVFSQIFDNPIKWILGHGHDIVETTWIPRGYYLSDIGMIGQSYYYGLIWLFLYLFTLYRYLIVNRRKLPLYVVLYMFVTFVTSLFSGPYYDNSSMFVWICTLYICHIHIDNKNNEYENLIINPVNN